MFELLTPEQIQRVQALAETILKRPDSALIKQLGIKKFVDGSSVAEDGKRPDTHIPRDPLTEAWVYAVLFMLEAKGLIGEKDDK